MHGYYWGFRGMPRARGFSYLNYTDSPLGFWLMLGLMLLIAVAIVLLIVNVRKRNRDEDSEAMATIKRRYANGELTNEDFQRMKKDLL